MKNECGKTRKVNEPYEVYRNEAAGWEWRVLKKWQAPDKETNNPYARWFCAVKSPMTGSGYDMGDVYVSEVIGNGRKVNTDVVILERW
jgi:hypothetical protein